MLCGFRPNDNTQHNLLRHNIRLGQTCTILTAKKNGTDTKVSILALNALHLLSLSASISTMLVKQQCSYHKAQGQTCEAICISRWNKIMPVQVLKLHCHVWKKMATFFGSSTSFDRPLLLTLQCDASLSGGGQLRAKVP